MNTILSIKAEVPDSLQVLNIEFILLWCTYLAIMLTNLELGILIGIILVTMYFAFSYARVCFLALAFLSRKLNPLEDPPLKDQAFL